MRLRTKLITVLSLLAASLPLLAVSNTADAPHVHVQLVIPASSLARGAAADAGLYFKIDSGWHVYWKNAGDAGEPPHLKWTLPQGITAGPLQFPAPKRLPLPPLMDFGYEDEVLFPFQLTVAQSANAGSAVLHTKADWLVCQATCIPGKAELEVTRTIADAASGAVSPDSDLYKRMSGRLPLSLPAGATVSFQSTKDGFRLTVKTGHRETEASFFPADQDILANAAPQKVTPKATGLTLDLAKDPNGTTTPTALNGVLELSGGRAYDIAAKGTAGAAGSIASAPAQTAPATETPIAAPAVASNKIPEPPSAAPIAPTTNRPPPESGPGLLKAASFAFLGGLLLNLMPCVFPVLFLKGLSLVNSGNEERHKLRTHGFVYAVGILVSFWVLVAALLGLRAAGATLGWGFQFQSPVFLTLMAGLLFFLGLSLAGQFEIGLTLTSAGGSLAQKHGYAGSFFTGVLAVVVATPCTAPFMGAAIGYALSQSAAVTLAVFTALALGLAAPYVALTLRPEWTSLLPKPGVWMEVLRQAVAVPIFATVIWLAWVLANAYGASLVAVLLLSLLILAIAGWFLGRWPAKGWSTTTAILLCATVVAGSVLAPRMLGDRAPRGVAAAADGQWQPWTADAVERAQAAGRPVFVDFTASWCLSCQVNERVALERPEVEQALAGANVALFKADWTRYDDSITQALASFGRSGVPTYALYAPGEKSPRLLPEALTPGIVLDAVHNLPHAATQASIAPSN